ncbi:hypothetical protein [Ereboglobus luteus]|uniref:hypothetical protein n=1 Tax=Ereboglobus luteus TaxID=1796921 RepID=UPI00126027C3|nr:hypothetical protein [Ereboglobus luteus]
MGKPFRSELAKLPASMEWAATVDTTPIADFFNQARGHLLVAVGAGGSFTAAELLRLLHENRNATAVAHTPLSFIQSSTDLRQAYVVIYTASGNNRDVLATYEIALAKEPLGILIVCGRRGSKIETKSADNERTTIFAHSLPSGRDGYLATNSLAIFCAFTLQAFQIPIVGRIDTPKSVFKLQQSTSHYIVIYSDWARPAAVDLESKFSEAGLGGVMLADYRHFAHGRHNWIDKHSKETTVIALITPDSACLAKKTLALLPAAQAVVKLATQTKGALGGFELLMDVFNLTAYVGTTVGIDPGRPSVPSYGSKIYHLGPTKEIVGQAMPSDAPTRRKQAARGTLGELHDLTIVEAAQRDYIASLTASRFGALVLDFDGTTMRPGSSSETMLPPPVRVFLEKFLKNNIVIYFATGRGDSIHQIVTNSLVQCHHSQVFISYYNGAVTRKLTEPPPANGDSPYHSEFEMLRGRILADSYLRKIVEPNNKSYQLTIKTPKSISFSAIATIVKERLFSTLDANRFRVVESSHSLDVIPLESTKRTAIRAAKKSVPDGLNVLAIGDYGAIGGNDYEMLTHPYSLSVDTVSPSLTSCWNLLPAGIRNVAGLLTYTKKCHVRRGYFTLKLR